MPYGQFGILQHNLNFLFAGMKRGGKQDAAAVIGVSSLTLSRWLSGTRDLSPRHLAAILNYFGLPKWLPIHVAPLTSKSLLRYRIAQRILTLPDEQLHTIACEYLLKYLQAKLQSAATSATALPVSNTGDE
jgi:transcriptional regulator with XRE-family HTH domain